jgi:hypothetical protein
VRRRSSVPIVWPALGRYLGGRDWGRSGGLQGANRHRITAIVVYVEASTVSIGGGGSAINDVPVGEVRRMVDGGRRRCGMESSFL